MGRCSDDFERYFFKSKCSDGWAECENKDDEDPMNLFCNAEQTTTTPG